MKVKERILGKAKGGGLLEDEINRNGVTCECVCLESLKGLRDGNVGEQVLKLGLLKRREFVIPWELIPVSDERASIGKHSFSEEKFYLAPLGYVAGPSMWLKESNNGGNTKLMLCLSKELLGGRRSIF